MDHKTPACDVGFCTNEAARRVEIRRRPTDKFAAEVRRICWDSSCAHLVKQSASDFSVQIVRGL
jgi:hypothetical protein